MRVKTFSICRRFYAIANTKSKYLLQTTIDFLPGLCNLQKRPARGSAAMRQPVWIVRLKTVLAHTRLLRSTNYRKIAVGTFPGPTLDQHQWRRMAARGHQPMGRRSFKLATGGRSRRWPVASSFPAKRDQQSTVVHRTCGIRGAMPKLSCSWSWWCRSLPADRQADGARGFQESYLCGQ